MAAPPEAVWGALVPTLETAFSGRGTGVLDHILGCRDRGEPTLRGFHVERSETPRLLALAGEHRFARYRLTFHISPTDPGSMLWAVTHAVFPGLHGRLYRALVVGSGGHRIVTRRILRAIARRAERTAGGARTAG
ncbi:MAG: hypothetical protein ABR559_09015 [Gemmatimonadota bacterium]